MNYKRKGNVYVIILLVAAGVIINALGGGVRSNFGIIIQPLSDSSGISYASISFILGVAQLMYGLTQPLWGMLAMKKTNSLVIICGIPLMAGGLIITAFTHSYAVMLLSLGLMVGGGAGALCFGMIMGAISPILGSGRAATASGILNAGSGIGGAALSPIIQAISSSSGISNALMFLAGPFVAMLPVVFWMNSLEKAAQSGNQSLRSEDTKGGRELTETGLGSNALKGSAAGNDSSLAVLRGALGSADYRRLMAGFATCGFHMIIIHTHMVSHFVSLGISAASAALIYTAYGIFTMIGAVVSGLLCTRFHLKNVLGSLYGTRAIVVAIFLFVAPKNLISMIVFAFILGMTGDATVTPTSEIISRRFGAKTMGFLFGITYVCHQIGAFVSSWLGGIFIDNMGNYSLIWIIDIMLCALAALVSFRISIKQGE